MRGTDMDTIPISETAKKEIQDAKDILNSLQANRHGADVGAWFTCTQNTDATLDFRVPFADHKHPSGVSVDIHATTPENVFSSGKYSAIRFETIGQRNPTKEKLRRLYSSDKNDDSTDRELQRKHDDVIKQRKYTFDEIAHNCAAQFSGISVYTDTGDGAFSGNDHRPHIRLQAVNTDGNSFGKFIQTLVDRFEKFYAELPHDRFMQS